MKWTPKTEEQIAAENLCAEGEAPFTVLEAADAVSQKGKDMIKLKVNVHGGDGRDYHVYDYISPHFFEHKFRHFFYAVGRGHDYERGALEASRLVGLTGYADIGQQEGNSAYGPKNVIVDYVVKEAGAGAKAGPPKVAPDGAVAAAPPEEDDVPF